MLSYKVVQHTVLPVMSAPCVQFWESDSRCNAALELLHT